MNYLMGIDIGTSGTKTIVINENGQLKASAFVEHKLDCPKPGWAQQNPQEWWNAAVESIKQVLKNGHLKAVI